MLMNRCLYLRNHSQVVCVYLGDPEELIHSEVSTIDIADMPKRHKFDWAELVYSVEPEYAMDAPTFRCLVNWFWVMLALGWGVAFPVAIIVARVCRFGQSLRRFLFRTLTFVLAICGTTVISRWLNDFVFTWPLALAVMFEWSFSQVKTRAQLNRIRNNESPARYELWIGRISLLTFVAVCACYFLVCRRLSLAFEWSFLLGFPAAVPFLLVFRRAVLGAGDSADSRFREWIFTAFAFAAFYWLGAAIILLKY